MLFLSGFKIFHDLSPIRYIYLCNVKEPKIFLIFFLNALLALITCLAQRFKLSVIIFAEFVIISHI